MEIRLDGKTALVTGSGRGKNCHERVHIRFVLTPT